MPATTRPLFEQIDSWLQEIDNTKTAASKPAVAKPAVKKAAPAGMGETSHPSEKVDNDTHPADTGARFAENSTDVKADVPGQSVDATDPHSGGSQDDKQYNIGTNQKATGEDASVEDDYKGDKDDPGTSHPADAESTGEKYSSMAWKPLLKAAEDKAHALLADLANGIAQDKSQSVQQKVAAVKAAAPIVVPPVAPKPEAVKSAAAAYDASAQLATDMEKQAAAFIEQTIKDADLDADLVGSFLYSYQQTRQKKAADEAAEGEDHSKGPDAPPADAPPEGAGGDVLSALGAGAGGPPPGDAPPMADPAAGGGAPPGAGGPPPGAGGGMNQEQALQELVMALQELGISPEELAAMAQQGAAGGAGGAGGPPPGAMAGAPMGGAGGAPMGPPPEMGGEGAKLASAAKQFKMSGKFKFEEAKTAAQRQARDQIKDYIKELVGVQ